MKSFTHISGPELTIRRNEKIGIFAELTPENFPTQMKETNPQ